MSHGLVGQGSPIEHLGEEAEMMETEAEEEETCHLLLEEIEKNETTGQS